MKKSKDYQKIEFPLFRKLVMDASRLAKKKSTIYGLVEFDVSKTMKKIRQYRINSKSPLSLTAFVIACIGRAVTANKPVHGYLNRSNQLICFNDVDCCLPIEMNIDGNPFPANHDRRHEVNIK